MSVSNSPGSWLPIVPGEIELDDPAEIYMRQCHPNFYIDGEPTSQMWRESTGDNGKLSGARSAKTSAEEAYHHRTEVVGRPSAGTFGVTVAEIGAAGTRAVDDSGADWGDFTCPPGHTFLDLRHLSDGERRSLRRRLAVAVRKNRRLWPEDETA